MYFVEIVNNEKFLFKYENNNCVNLIEKLYYDKNFYNECIENSKQRKNIFFVG